MKPTKTLVVVAALMVGACVRAPSMEELIRSADALTVPANWELVGEESAGPPCSNPVENCPSVELTYRVSGEVDFGEVIVRLFVDAGFDVWYPPGTRCHTNPDPGCSVAARIGDIGVRATVIDAAPESYGVTIRADEYVAS